MRIVSNLTVCGLLVSILTACEPATESPATEPAELVLVGGKIVTVDEDNPQVEALAARGGKIVTLGSRAEIEALVGEGTEVLDLAGGLAIPGFIEGHGHFLSLGDARIQLDLTTGSNWQAIVDQVEQAVAEAQPGEWIRGRGWHQDKWDAVPSPNVEGFPVHDSLSAVSPENPVLLTHASGHALFANAKAMELAGVDDSTADPPGGDILRDAEGRATGVFRENAEELIHRARSASGETPAEELRKMAELASDECLAKGVTSFQDAGSSFEEIARLHKGQD